jgi:hypothetical protein
MNLTTEQDARFTAIINCFGDAFAQDRTDQRMHEWLAIIRNEMVDEWCVPVWHKELIPQLDWLDRVLDKIEARRKSTAQIVGANLRSMFVLESAEMAGQYQLN